MVITGASKGLGGSLAVAAARQGAQVIAAARSRDDLAALAKAAALTTELADVTIAADVERVAQATVTQFGRIDVWINNAGIWTSRMPMEELPPDRLRAMVEVNFFGTWHGCRAAVQQMKRQGSGTIVNILSISALKGRAGSAGYVASKGAAIGLTKSLRQEVAAAGIRVIAVYPGGMKTDIFHSAPPPDYDTYMDPSFVADRILANLRQADPEDEQIIIQQ